MSRTTGARLLGFNLALLAVIAFLNAEDASRYRSTPTAELRWLPLPGGYELDWQQTKDGWAVFWQSPDGASTKLAGGQ